MNEIISIPSEKTGFGQLLFRFDNGYGASVIRKPFSYGGADGLFELAVIEWEGDDFKLVYTTSITSDVIGHLTEKEVEEILEEIKGLTKMLNSGKIEESE